MAIVVGGRSGLMRHVPNVLSSVRIACAPALMLVAIAGEQAAYTWLLVPALLTDAADGWIARAWGLQSSPDGKYIAYDISEEGQADEKRDIFVLSADGSTVSPLIVHPAIDTVIDWTPGGEGLLFLSDRTGTEDVWFIRVAGGKPQGEPLLVKPGVGAIIPMGITTQGALFYGLLGGATDVYEVGIDPQGGKILAPVKKAVSLYRDITRTRIILLTGSCGLISQGRAFRPKNPGRL